MNKQKSHFTKKKKKKRERNILFLLLWSKAQNKNALGDTLPVRPQTQVHDEFGATPRKVVIIGRIASQIKMIQTGHVRTKKRQLKKKAKQKKDN